MVVDGDCPHNSLQPFQSEEATLDCDRMERRLKTLSRGLTEAVKSSNARIVQFIHQSVKDFFVEKGLSALDEPAKTDLIVGIAHSRLSRTYIRYLAMEEIAQSTSQNRDYLVSAFPLLRYATTSWVVHAKESEINQQYDLLPSEPLFKLWVQTYGIIDRYSEDCPPGATSILHIVSRYQLIGPLQVILQGKGQHCKEINGSNDYGRTPLLLAAENGHEDVVQKLLEKGTNLEANDDNDRAPLLLAAQNGGIRMLCSSCLRRVPTLRHKIKMARHLC